MSINNNQQATTLTNSPSINQVNNKAVLEAPVAVEAAENDCNDHDIAMALQRKEWDVKKRCKQKKAK